MRTTHRASLRALILIAATGTTLATTMLVGVGTASAHVHVASTNAAPGSTSILTFNVPGESETGSLTTEFTVMLPNVASARTELLPGWTAKLDRDVAAGTVRSVTWTAAPTVGISPEQFALFNISVKLPDQPSVSLPSIQKYADGTVVRWDQPPLPNGDEPEHPVPVLNLTGSGGEDPDDHAPAAAPTSPQVTAAPASAADPAAQAGPTRPDDTARWLAGGALVLAAIGTLVAVLGRRRA